VLDQVGIPGQRQGAATSRWTGKARGLPADYKKKVVSIDRQYYHTAVGATAPLVQRLESLGELLCLVVGAYGEVSRGPGGDGVAAWHMDHNLITILQTSLVAIMFEKI
jgi:hypothetical protein